MPLKRTAMSKRPCEHRVQIGFRVPADGAVARVRVMSVRLFSPENRRTLENLLTLVSKLNRVCASLSLTTAYRPRRKPRLARATSGAQSRFENAAPILPLTESGRATGNAGRAQAPLPAPRRGEGHHVSVVCASMKPIDRTVRARQQVSRPDRARHGHDVDDSAGSFHDSPKRESKGMRSGWKT